MTRLLPALFALIAAPVSAQETRQLDAHEHGVGELNIAIDGEQVLIELHAPGADIVGFEHPAESDADRAAIAAAIEELEHHAMGLFSPAAAAECTLVDAHADLEGDEHHEEHDDHADHADHDDHADHADEESNHTEFHAEYMMTCAHPEKISPLMLGYFAEFENAQALQVQMVSPNGATAVKVARDTPELDLGALF